MNQLSHTKTDLFDQLGIVKQASDLVCLFNQCFEHTENTILVGNADEPIYKPADAQCQFNQIIFTYDYFSSALHEIAHWCIAGNARRKQIDYGYWYTPDGRDAQQQANFEAVEVKPQALEYAFSLAADISFRVSIDNLQGADTCGKQFEAAVQQQLMNFIETGFNARTQEFLTALHDFYQTEPLSAFRLDKGKENLSHVGRLLNTPTEPITPDTLGAQTMPNMPAIPNTPNIQSSLTASSDHGVKV